MRKFLLPGTAVATAALAVLPLTSASAASRPHVLTNGKGGSAVKVGAILQGGIKGKVRFVIPGTKVGLTCSKASIKDRVRSNPRVPGVAVESLIGQRFSKCTTSIPGTTGIRSIQILGLPYRTTINSRASHVVTVFRLRTRVTLNSVLGPITCSYGARLMRGRAVNPHALNIFVNQRFTKTAGSNACPKASDLNVTFGPIRNFSVRGHPVVYYNK